MDILLLIAGLALILAGANYLTDGAASIALRFRVPEFIVGLTIVAVGTSTPELVVSVLSALKGNSDVAVGNVVGSNLFNVFVILGICALITPMALTRGNIRRDIPIGFGAALLLALFSADRFLHLGTADRIGRGEGLFMVVCYIVLMIFTVRQSSREHRANPAAATAASTAATTAATTAAAKTEKDEKPIALWLAIVMIAGGLAGLIFGGELFLNSATSLARRMGVSESIIAITLVAGGTSLPELASSVISMLKGKADLALGNVVGSNIANILLILGVSASIHPLSMGGITHADIGMVVLSSLLLFLTAFTFRRRMLDRWEGAIFLLIYIGYIGYLLH